MISREDIINSHKYSVKVNQYTTVCTNSFWEMIKAYCERIFIYRYFG